ncbi:MAG: hypothetical protein LBT59_28495 [Clostridiales bacterium]|jgi:hypothetical protein|nr:hypothetical protein [Clostridiales bacterium]
MKRAIRVLAVLAFALAGCVSQGEAPGAVDVAKAINEAALPEQAQIASETEAVATVPEAVALLPQTTEVEVLMPEATEEAVPAATEEGLVEEALMPRTTEEAQGSVATEEAAIIQTKEAVNVQEPTEEDARLAKLVNERLRETMNTEAYKNADIPERMAIVTSLLEELKAQGAIRNYVQGEDVISFAFSDGSLGGAILKDFNGSTN